MRAVLKNDAPRISGIRRSIECAREIAIEDRSVRQFKKCRWLRARGRLGERCPTSTIIGRMIDGIHIMPRTIEVLAHGNEAARRGRNDRKIFDAGIDPSVRAVPGFAVIGRAKNTIERTSKKDMAVRRAGQGGYHAKREGSVHKDPFRIIVAIPTVETGIDRRGKDISSRARFQLAHVKGSKAGIAGKPCIAGVVAFESSRCFGANKNPSARIDAYARDRTSGWAVRFLPPELCVRHARERDEK